MHLLEGSELDVSHHHRELDVLLQAILLETHEWGISPSNGAGVEIEVLRIGRHSPSLAKVAQGDFGMVLAVVVEETRLEIIEELLEVHCFPVEDFGQVRLRPGCRVVSHEGDGKCHLSGVGGEALRIGDSMEANLANKLLG